MADNPAFVTDEQKPGDFANNQGYISDKQTPGHFGYMSHGSFRRIDPESYITDKKAPVPLDTISDGTVLPRKPEEPSEPEVRCVSTWLCLCIKNEKVRIYKNIVIMSLTFLFNFTAFQSLSNLQSSLNITANLGTISLAVVYGALVLSCMFLPKFLIRHLGCKWTVTLAVLCYTVYIACNFYPAFETLIPGAIVLGFGAAPLWSAKCTYLTETGIEYAKLSGERSEVVINRFFGFFFLVFQTGQIWGNLISSLVLNTANGTYTISDEELDKCGANFCPTTNITNQNLSSPDEERKRTMIAIYLGTSVAGSLLAFLFLDTLKREKVEAERNRPDASLNDDRSCSEKWKPQMLVATFLHMRNFNQLLLIPLTIYSGLEQAFLGGDFTQAFVSCSLGIYMVGFTIICFGVANSLCSYIFGQLMKYIGRIPFFVLAALLNYGVQIAWLLWRPDPNQLVVFFVFAALWGVSDAVWQAHINALYGSIFSDNSEAAFSNYRLWESLGFIIAYAYQGFLCVPVKIYVLIGVLTIGMAGYFTVEILERRRKRKE
ncbi:unnamed protein product [Owenia fusiformis]|uniref:Uncharacterized protein n=1 Tax=Owenia fusiformis TaxID=6347 RepID=A0A8J1UT58_OWEFU|nr:unnamed protein product [Owenia fusiformis]